MPQKQGRYGNIDELIARTTPHQVAAHLGVELPDRHTGELRMACCFNKDCADSTYGTLTVNLDDPANRIFCHSCGVRGNLLTLIHGLRLHKPPASGRLRGEEFKLAADIVRDVHGDASSPASRVPGEDSGRGESAPGRGDPGQAAPGYRDEAIVVNVPLKRAENERARSLVTLDDDLLVRSEEMNADAASYFRRRQAWLTPVVARKWRMGYLPNSSKGLLRGRIVYGMLDQRGDVLSWFGRDPAFEKKHKKWIEAGRPENGKPIKHRFVRGFHRGLELFGQHVQRLEEPEIRESLHSNGLVIVEGPNDVIRLDCLGVAAVGLCSNKATDEQVEKITQFARQTADGRVVLLGDNDPEGESGFSDLAWKLLERGDLSVRLGWSRAMFDGRFRDRQPESLSIEEFSEIRGRLIEETEVQNGL